MLNVDGTENRGISTSQFVGCRSLTKEYDHMPGPIVRSGPSKKFTEQWDSVFGKKTEKQAAGKTAKKKVAKKKK
jgi:hypothetical protein